MFLLFQLTSLWQAQPSVGDQGKLRAAPASGRNHHSGRGPRGLRPLLLGMAGAALVGLLLASLPGCSGEQDSNGERQLPAYAYNSAPTLAGYKVAARAPNVLAAIPCYCGCGLAQGHTSLKDCFFSPDGSFADHASNCHLCVEEAIDVGKWYDAGLTLKDIRARIVEKYSENGPSTNTPPIE